MTASKSAAARARAKYLTVAKRSLRLITEEAARHAGLLGKGEVPESSFLVSALRYNEALAALGALDGLGTGDEQEAPAPDNGTAEVRRDDLRALVSFTRGIVPAHMAGMEDTPLTRLRAAAEEPPWSPEPAQAAEAGSEEGA